MKKSVVNNRYPAVRGQFDEASLELCFDPVPKQKVLIFYSGLAGSQSRMKMPYLGRRGYYY